MKKNVINIIKGITFFIVIFLFFSYLWAKKVVGNIRYEQIVFTLQAPMSGTNISVVFDFILKTIVPTILLEGVFLFLCFKIKLHTKNFTLHSKNSNKSVTIYPFNNIVFFISLSIVLIFSAVSAAKSFGIIDYYKLHYTPSNFIEENYISPDNVKIEFPEKKRNLIYILLESGESSNMDFSQGGLFNENYIPELTAIAENNISFSQSDLLQGAEVAPGGCWTIGGMVSEFSGIPLKPTIYKDSIKDTNKFLPGVTNLGQILENEGYKNYYMIGSDSTFACRNLFMSQHGNYEILDYPEMIKQGKIPEDYKKNWGFEDSKLFEMSKEKLLEISKNEEPFNFTLLTADTHFPNGFVCNKCKTDYDSQYANVWACSSRLVKDFVDWIKTQDFYKNTAIVICGDHKSMDGHFYKGKDRNRFVYNAFVNPASSNCKEKNRKFTTLDMFPTTIAALGARIEGNRLGLGTNLFSSKATIPEEIGYKKFFTELDKKSEYYNREFCWME